MPSLPDIVTIVHRNFPWDSIDHQQRPWELVPSCFEDNAAVAVGLWVLRLRKLTPTGRGATRDRAMTVRRAATALAVLLAMTACSDDAGDTGSRGGEQTRESFFGGLTASTATTTTSEPAATTTTSEPSLAEQQPIRASTVESVNRCFRAWWSLRNPSRETFPLSDVVELTDLCDDAVVATEADRRGIEGPTPLNTIAVAAAAIRLEAATLHLEIASGDRICPDSWCETGAEEVLLDLNLPNEAVELLPDTFTGEWSAPRVSDFTGIAYAE